MSYLVVKILFLLALAALCGGLFAYWLLRRRFIDVTDEYERFIRASAAQRAADLGPLEQRLAEVAQAQGAANQLAFSSLGQRLSEIEQYLASFRPPDLGSLESGIDSLGARLSRLDAVIDQLHPVDLGPLTDRIDRFQQQLSSLEAYLSRQPAPAPPPVAPPNTGIGRNLLKGPSFGPPDDLKRIRGIGSVLDRLLHRLGVFYFWQIAESLEDDVAYVDDRLDVFKGRIERDAWVRQAAHLAQEPDTAKLPSPSTRATPQGQYSVPAP
jgi:predicted flap endonuclease-1-like 5' DNA nuclease